MKTRVTKGYWLGTIMNGHVYVYVAQGEFRTPALALEKASSPNPLLPKKSADYIFECYSDFRSLPGSLGSAYGPIAQVIACPAR